MIKSKIRKIIVGLFLFAGVLVAQAEQPVDQVVAVVNDQVITSEQLNNQMALLKKQMQSSKTPVPDDSTLRQQVLQRLINRRLQLQQAHQHQLKVSEKQLKQALTRIAQQNKTTVQHLYKSAKAAGFSRQDFRNEVKKEILIQMIQAREVSPRISISKQAVDDYLNILKNNKKLQEYHLGDILIALPESPSPKQVESAKAKARQAVKKLHHGADFKKLAASVSKGEQALQGGDMGWRRLAELPTPFINYVKSMKQGEVAGPIHTPNGYHVIKLLGVRNSAGLKGSEKQKRKQVEQMLFQRQFNQALMNWIAQLRAQAYVKIESKN